MPTEGLSNEKFASKFFQTQCKEIRQHAYMSLSEGVSSPNATVTYHRNILLREAQKPCNPITKILRNSANIKPVKLSEQFILRNLLLFQSYFYQTLSFMTEKFGALISIAICSHILWHKLFTESRKSIIITLVNNSLIIQNCHFDT